MIQLRPYQDKMVGDVYESWHAGHRNVLAVAPTGAGKTLCMSKVAQDVNGPAVAIAHRQELVGQISMAMARMEITHNIIASPNVIKFCVSQHVKELGQSFYHHNAPFAVGGVQTLTRRGDELGQWMNRVRQWTIDECHHIQEKNLWGKAVAMFPNAHGLGFTATPTRCDGKSLHADQGGVFHDMIIGPTMRELIDMGYLCEYRIYGPPQSMNIDNLTIGATGDFTGPSMRKEAERSTITGDMISHYMRIAPGKRAIVFVVDIEQATKTAEAFRSVGIRAEAVSSNTPAHVRVALVEKFGRGDIDILVNVDLFGEGFDVPAVEVVIMGRPTQSYGLYCLSDDTEILTPDGWKGIDDDFSHVSAFNMSDSTIVAADVLSRIERPMLQDEVMYGVKAPHLDILVSDQHDMLVKSRGDNSGSWTKQTAEEASMRKSLYKLPVAGFGNHKGANLSKHELHLLGWYLSDGNVNKANNALSIGQAINKTEHINHIRSTLVGCGLKFGEHIIKRKNCPETHHDLVVFTVSKGVPRGRDKHLKGWSEYEKWLHKDVPTCYNDLTRDQFLTLLEALNLGDGNNNHDSLDYTKRSLTIACGDNGRMADRIQEMCVTRGLRCNQAYPHYDGRSQWHVLHIKDVLTSTLPGVNDPDGVVQNKKPYIRSRFVKVDTRPDKVWCVSNELGTLVTRRNGKVAIVGNCQQFGRVLRVLDGKEFGIVIDHVGNVIRHGLPDAPRAWELMNTERGRRSTRDPDVMKVTTCVECFSAFEAITAVCPFCGHVQEPESRSQPKFVDGDLIEFSPELLASLRGEIEEIDRECPVKALDPRTGAMRKNWNVRQETQGLLREAITLWAGIRKDVMFMGDSEIYRRFYNKFGIDVMSAQTLGTKDANKLLTQVREDY